MQTSAESAKEKSKVDKGQARIQRRAGVMRGDGPMLPEFKGCCSAAVRDLCARGICGLIRDRLFFLPDVC